jgi:hypothetical protein
MEHNTKYCTQQWISTPDHSQPTPKKTPINAHKPPTPQPNPEYGLPSHSTIHWYTRYLVYQWIFSLSTRAGEPEKLFFTVPRTRYHLPYSFQKKICGIINVSSRVCLWDQTTDIWENNNDQSLSLRDVP